jgi:dihydrofolate reductase
VNEVVLIVAAAANGVIGRGGAIPWRLPEDLRRFKALTLGHAVVMGRKTWDSLPKKPLPGRQNFVVTRDAGWTAPGALPVTSPDIALVGAAPGTAIMVIGGAQIYRHFLPQAARIELTEVHRDFDGDARFYFDRAQWRETAREDHVGDDGLAYSFVTLARLRREA